MKKQILSISIITLFFVFVAINKAESVILTFDDITEVTLDSLGTINNPYHGFKLEVTNFQNTQTNWIHTDGSVYPYNDDHVNDQVDWIDTGGFVYPYGSISGRFTMLGKEVIISSDNNQTFSFNGLYSRIYGTGTGSCGLSISGWYNNGNDDATSFDNNILAWNSYTTLTEDWSYFSGPMGADITKVDKIRLYCTGNAFLVDNLELKAAPVPEPATILLFSAGLSCIGIVVKRKRQCLVPPSS